jgi:hypothetical protein
MFPLENKCTTGHPAEARGTRSSFTFSPEQYIASKLFLYAFSILFTIKDTQINLINIRCALLKDLELD